MLKFIAPLPVVSLPWETDEQASRVSWLVGCMPQQWLTAVRARDVDRLSSLSTRVAHGVHPTLSCLEFDLGPIYPWYTPEDPISFYPRWR